MNLPMERHNAPLRFRGPRRLPMALIACALAASPIALPPVAGAQTTGVAAVPPPLIVFGQERSFHAGGSAPGLTDEQAATLDTLRSDPLVSEIRLGQSAPAALADAPVSRSLSIPVPGTAPGALVFTGVAVEHNAEGMVSLHARKEANDSSVSLVVQGADVLGSIEHGGEVWRVAPMGGGLTAVYRYDTSSLRMDPPGWGWRQKRLAPEPRPMDDAGASVEGADTGDVIDLMVVYTPAAAAMGNIDAFIQFALNNTHEAYRNSNIPFRLRLVHKAQVSYAEHEIMGEDLNRLNDHHDGHMDEIHDLRNRYGADLVALVVAGPADGVGTCGVAWVPEFGRYPTDDFEDWGFSVTGRSCESTNYRVFAHEIGHNQGALHDPYNSPNECPTGPDSCNDAQTGNFRWRYGRCNTEQGWNTVMAYQLRAFGGEGDCSQSAARFSSPDVVYRGVPTGDAARRDNRRVLLETARRVANFRQSVTDPPPPPPPPPSRLSATLPYVAPAGQGIPSLVRVLNDSAEPNTVQVTGYDDSGRRFGPEALSVPAHQAATLNSNVLESGGGTGGGTFAGLGDGEGWWRLELEGERAFRAGMYYRTADGFFLAELSAPVAGEQDGTGRWRYDVAFFNPGSNTSKVSFLRLANPNDQAAEVVVAGRDDRGREAPGGTVTVSLPAQGAATFTAQALENGGNGLTGRLGDGEGKWRLTVTADRPVQVMSLLHATQTGHLANLSAIVQGAQGSAPPPPPEPDDHGDTPATATLVQMNSSTTGRLGASGDKDYFRIVLPQRGTLQIRTTGGTDTAGTLLLGDRVVATDDNGGSGTNFSITVRAAHAGTWYVEVKGHDSATRGGYTLQVEFSNALQWGAIAAGWVGESCSDGYGWSAALNRRDQASARSEAVSACEGSGLRNCLWKVVFSSCGALAYGTTTGIGCNVFGGYGPTRAAAESHALSLCREGYSQCTTPADSSSGRNASYCNANARAAPHAEAQSGGYMAGSPPGPSRSGSRLIPDRSPRPVVEER